MYCDEDQEQNAFQCLGCVKISLSILQTWQNCWSTYEQLHAFDWSITL